MKKIFILILLSGLAYLSTYAKGYSISRNIFILKNGKAKRIIIDDFEKSIIINFLKWYEKNKKLLHKNRIVKGGGVVGSNYYISSMNKEKYLYELSKSGYLSNIYIDSLNEYLERCNQNLKKYPQNDGPIQGLESDIVMKAQDYLGIIENLDSATIESISKYNNSEDIILTFAKYYKMSFTITKYNKRWQIDKINGDFPIVISHY